MRVDARQVQIVFPATGMLRHYAQGSAPLVRARFQAGERILVQREPLRVDEVVDRDGLVLYRAGGREIAEGELDDSQPVSQANQRLISGRVDRNSAFALRLEALARRAEMRASAAYGVLSARIGLIPHQLRVAEAVSQRRPPRALLADEVGLGKTIEAGLIVSRQLASGRATRVLVLAPEALVYQWFVELKRRFNLGFAIYDEERAESIELEGGSRNPFSDDQLVLTDPAFLLESPKRAEQVIAAGWDLMVVDEAHHLQWSPEYASPAYVLVERLAAGTPGLVLLTATPEQLGRTGHFARLRLLDPARFHDLGEYQRESESYLARSALAAVLEGDEPLDHATRGTLESMFAGDAEAQRLLAPETADRDARAALLDRLVDRHGTGRVMFRNRRASVGGFPDREPAIDVLAGPDDPAQREQLLEEFLGDLAQPPSAPPLQYADDPRLHWLIGLLETHANDKFLLICRCQAKLHALEEALRGRSGVALSRFHEGLGIVQRDRNAAYFAEPGGARLLLATEIGSEGRNFQFAHRLVLWDLPLDPDLLEQRIGRLDRIGQRHPITLHVAVHEGSAQHALVRWFDGGLNAFRQSPEDGRELLKRYGERVTAAACAMARSPGEAEGALQDLIAETAATHAELAERIASGRDRLLELSARRASSDALAHALEEHDDDAGYEPFVVRLLEHYGVHVDEHDPDTVLLDPEMMSTEALPGLADGKRVASFDRATALAREDAAFLRADHPLVQGALDVLLESETGNAAFLVDPALPPRSALLEAVYVLECVAAERLDVARFLPPRPVRVVLDSRTVDRSDYRVARELEQRADQLSVESHRYRSVFARLVPPLLAACEQRAGVLAQADIAAAAARADDVLGAEHDRLQALARVNASVRPQELAALVEERRALAAVIPDARLRLDALRLVVSRDFLALAR